MHEVGIGLQLVQHGNIGRACDLAITFTVVSLKEPIGGYAQSSLRVVLPKITPALSESCSHLVCALCKKSFHAIDSCLAVYFGLKNLDWLRSIGLTQCLSGFVGRSTWCCMLHVTFCVLHTACLVLVYRTTNLFQHLWRFR